MTSNVRNESAAEYRGSDPCSLANAVQVVGEKWSFFVLREALAGAFRFSEFRQRLGIASDVLTNRLDRLVAARIMERREYREPGQRARDAYHLTSGGRELGLAIVALQQWGDEFTPSRTPPSITVADASGGVVRAAYVDRQGTVLDPDDIRFVRES